MARCRPGRASPQRARLALRDASARGVPTGFTLAEVLVGVVIVAILLSITGLAFRGLTESSVLAQARNAVVTYAQVARSYAMANHIETMLVVNSYNGRFEIWHLNPPPQGGRWDPLSSGDSSNPAELHKTDGYMLAPVLDASARMPLDGDGRPAAVVNPIDYEDRPTTGSDADQDLDNLMWAAFCFDENGQLVIRTRRIATRRYFLDDGETPNPNANRLEDGSPNLRLNPLVDGDDTPITSTSGFVISDFSKMRSVLDEDYVTPQELADWLQQTRPGGRYEKAAATVVLNRFSGDQLGGGL
ncbi:MAG: prepilin-type N-terminal cleavage/methylation domain-containing protein [Phycisphaerae bacterium]|nr:prepilin-type N-terminal cleavage/methylation domain-containing protein [Phycisphaerae bacterium]